MTESKPRAVIYCRVSSRAQETDGTSLESQATACQEYATQHGFNIVKVIKEVFSGAELFERPGIQRAREMIRKREADAIIFYALDRLSRNPVHSAIIREEVERAGSKLLCVSEDIDGSPEGQLIDYIRSYAAQMEREKIRERTMRGRKEKMLKGLIVGQGTCLYGYQINRETWRREVVESEAIVIRRIFRELERGKTGRLIASELRDEGIPQPSESKGAKRGLRGWTHDTVWMIGKERRYTGVECQNTRRVTRYYEGKRKIEKSHARPGVEHLPVAVGATPAIISEEQFERVQRILFERRSVIRSGKQTRYYFLQGFIFCQCGARCSPGGGGGVGRVPRYRCRTHDNIFAKKCDYQGSITAERAEAQAWEQLVKAMTSPDEIRRAYEARERRESDPYAEPLALLRKREATLVRGRERYARLVATAETDETADLFAQQAAALTRELSQVRAEIQEISQRQSAELQPRLSLDKIMLVLEKLRGQVKRTWTNEMKREAMFALEARAIHQNGHITVHIPLMEEGLEDSAGMPEMAAGFLIPLHLGHGNALAISLR